MSSVVFGQTDTTTDNKIIFPDIEGWVKGELVTYPTPELGYSIPYQSKEGGTITVYVYNGGIKSIADGVGDQNVITQMKNAENDIKKYGEMGYYENVKLIKSETVTLGGNKGTTKALYSLFAFKIRETEVDSEIYLFGHDNNFIKFRATRPKSEYSADNTAVHKFLLEIGKVFAK
jgi:hypothetical protein